MSVYDWTKGMSDRERILTSILMHVSPYIEDYRFKGEPGVFTGAYWAKPEPGDVVKCVTQRWPSKWCWAWLESAADDRTDRFMLREFGGEERCDMQNETVWALRGLRPEHLLEGAQWKFYVKVCKAMQEIDRFQASLSGVVWPDRHSNVATIGLRPHILLSPSGAPENKRWVSKPIAFAFEHKAKTKISDIVEAVRPHVPKDRDGWEFVLVDGGSGRCDLPVQVIA